MDRLARSGARDLGPGAPELNHRPTERVTPNPTRRLRECCDAIEKRVHSLIDKIARECPPFRDELS